MTNTENVQLNGLVYSKHITVQEISSSPDSGELNVHVRYSVHQAIFSCICSSFALRKVKNHIAWRH